MGISGFRAAFFNRWEFLKASMLALALTYSADFASAQDDPNDGPGRLDSRAQSSAIDVTGAWAGTLASAEEFGLPTRYYLQLEQSGEALTGRAQFWFDVQNGFVAGDRVSLGVRFEPNYVFFDLIEAEDVLTGTATVNRNESSAAAIRFEHFDPEITFIFPIRPEPAYPRGSGPVVLVDGGHNNYTVVERSDAPFEACVRRDGYRVQTIERPFTANSLGMSDILIVPMPLSDENRAQDGVNTWLRPHPPVGPASPATRASHRYSSLPRRLSRFSTIGIQTLRGLRLAARFRTQ